MYYNYLIFNGVMKGETRQMVYTHLYDNKHMLKDGLTVSNT